MSDKGAFGVIRSLFASVNGEDPGHVFHSKTDGERRFRVRGDIIAPIPNCFAEIIVNGEVVRTNTPSPKQTPARAYEHHFDETVKLNGSGWIAVRCWEPHPEGRLRFAHTAPWFIEVEGKPLRPRREEAEFLVKRVEEEISRSNAFLTPAALEEYRQALGIFEAIAQAAK